MMSDYHDGSKDFRSERDSLGEVTVPAGAYYGAQTARAVENFPISGRGPSRTFIWSVALIKRAAADVHIGLGVLDDASGKAISAAADEVMKGDWDQHCVVDHFQAGAGTSHHMNINEVIANRATILLGGGLGEYLVHPNDHVNRSQSTNDVIPAAIHLGVLHLLDDFLCAVIELRDALESRAKAFNDVLKTGRTHLQDAVPMTLGQEFGGYAESVRRDANRIRLSAHNLRRIGIGGTAVGTGLNAPQAYPALMVDRLNELTGFELVLSRNPFESMQSMADLTDFSGSIRTLAITLTRIANDIRLLSSGPATGLNEIQLPAVQPGSSIMPGKINPVMAEMLNMAMIHLIGCDTAIALAAQAGQLELNVMMPLIAFELFEMMEIGAASIRSFTTRCVIGIDANRSQATWWLERNPVIATVLNPLLGYVTVAKLIRRAYQEQRPIREIIVEAAEQGSLLAREDRRVVSPAEVDAALSDLSSLSGFEQALGHQPGEA
ncbi:MAG: aspartate ammonia-lyase [Anaerolineales bacterium]|nr:aspartate ammonia-lyase [Anaerolineales bacterium]